MIAFVANYENVDRRKGMPSGVLIVHPTTGKVIAVGKSSLSLFLKKLFLEGISFVERDNLMQKKTVQIKKSNIASFKEAAPIYLKKANLKITVIDVKAPLSGTIPLDLSLNAAYDKPPFEKIPIGAAT